jgi:hypothetical protein
MSRSPAADDGNADPRPYRSILGASFDSLPRAVRMFHEAPSGTDYTGHARIRRGRGRLAILATWGAGFPASCEDVPLVVQVNRTGFGESWLRSYAGHYRASLQFEGTGRWAGLMVEKFALVRIGMALVAEPSSLRLVVKRWSVAGIPMPLALAPRGEIVEFDDDGKYGFRIDVSSPLTGPVVFYEGLLEPVRREMRMAA